MRQGLLFFLFPLFTACTSPREAFENQDYDKAYKLALASLNQGKGGKEERRILQQSLENILARESEEGRRLADSEKPEGWETTLGINYGLQEKIKEARAFLPEAFEKDLHTLTRQARWLRKSLYDHYYARGREDLEEAASTGLKEHAQLAHGAFTKARLYAEALSPQLDSLTQLAHRKGIVYYVVEIDAPFDITYNWEIEHVFSRLEEEGGGFLRIAYEEPLKNPDCAIVIRFNPLDIEIEEETGDEDFNREVIIEYETVTDTVGNETRVPVYGNVEGNVLIITRTKTATWEAEALINALTPNCSLPPHSFQASASSTAREIRTSGDERAIPREYLDAPEENFREEDDMVEELLEDLYEQVVRAFF